MAYKKTAYLEHMAIYVRDIKWHIDFFGDVFNMPVRTVDGDPACPNQVWLMGGIQLVAAPEGVPCEGRSAHLGMYAEDADACVAAAYERGVSQHPKGRNWVVLPDGLVIEILQAPAGCTEWFCSRPEKR